MTCGAPHPEDPSLTCVATSSHADHVAYIGSGLRREGVDWPNDEWRPPASHRTPRGSASVMLKGLADRVPPPTSRSRGEQRGVDADVIEISADHPETSHQMAARVLPKTGTQRRMVYDLALGQGERGVTDDEVEVALGMLHQSASAARNSLMNDGWLVDVGVRRPTRRGFSAIAWVAVPER